MFNPSYFQDFKFKVKRSIIDREKPWYSYHGRYILISEICLDTKQVDGWKFG